MEELMLKFLDEKADKAEEQYLLAWLETSSQNRKYFRYFASNWYASRVAGPDFLFDCLAILL